MDTVALFYQVVNAVREILNFIAVIVYLMKKFLIVMFFYSVFFREHHVTYPYLYVTNENGGLADISLLCIVTSFKATSILCRQ